MFSDILKVIGQWIVDNLGWSIVILLVILSGLFKITKIEINPIGWLLGWIGKYFTKDIDSKLTALKDDLDKSEEKTNKAIDSIKNSTNRNCTMLKKRLDAMEKSNDMQTARQIKAHVLSFANSCMNKGRHTKQDFENIIAENTEYEKLVKKYKLVNDVYKEDFEFIMKCYRTCQEKGSFLKESDVEAQCG